MAEEQGVTGVLDRHNVDALVMPTFASFHLPAIAGFPVITVPLGFFPAGTTLVMNAKGTMVNIAPNVPFGLAFIGRRWSEATMISLAYAFEQRTMICRKMRPYVTPTFELGDQIYGPSGPQVSNPVIGINNRLTHRKLVHSKIKNTFSKLTPMFNWTWSLLGYMQSSG